MHKRFLFLLLAGALTFQPLFLMTSCISPETKAKLATLETELGTTTAGKKDAEAELARILEKLKTAQGDAAVALEGERKAAATAVAEARLKEEVATKALIAAKAEADIERQRHGVQLLDQAKTGLGPLISHTPIGALILGFLTPFLEGAKKKTGVA